MAYMVIIIVKMKTYLTYPNQEKTFIVVLTAFSIALFTASLTLDDFHLDILTIGMFLLSITYAIYVVVYYRKYYMDIYIKEYKSLYITAPLFEGVVLILIYILLEQNAGILFSAMFNILLSLFSLAGIRSKLFMNYDLVEIKEADSKVYIGIEDSIRLSDGSVFMIGSNAGFVYTQLLHQDPEKQDITITRVQSLYDGWSKDKIRCMSEYLLKISMTEADKQKIVKSIPKLLKGLT